ncbi:MAG: PAS domain S-box protein, partial [Gemmatimonadetes bacterium]
IAFGDLIHPADRTRVWETVQTALQNHRPFEIEYRLIHKDGTERWVSERGIGTISPEDGQIWLEGIIIDITTQKQAEFQRRELETIINRSPVVVFLWENAEGWPVTYVSGSLNQWGYTPEAFYNRQINFAQIVHPDDLARVAVEVAQYSEEGRQEFTQHYRIRTASGEVRYVEDCTWVRRNEQNEITHYQGILLDITEQVKAEQRYQTIFETAGTALTILDETGLIRLANTEFSNLAGLPLNQIINKTRWQDFVAPDEIERMTHYQDERRRGSENVPDAYEFKFQDAAGNIKHILTRVKMIPDSSYSVASLMNFTSRKHAEEKLAWLAAVVQQATFSVVVTDLEGQIEYVNPYFEKITGYCPAEVIGENPRLLKSGKHDKSFYQQLWDTITQGNIWTGRFCNKRKDGTLYYEDAVIFPIRNSKGQMINYAGVKRDITEQVKAEEQLHFLANILENVQDSVIVTDLEQRILYWNNGAETILGYSAQEMLGQSIRQIHGGQVRIWGGDFENLMAGNDFIHEWEVQRKDGTTIWLDTKTTLMFDETGQPTGFINVAKDITVRKLAEIELQHAHDTLETRVEERTQELANVIQQMEQEMQDRLRAEEKLVESNEKFRQLAENVDTVFWIWDIELEMLIYVNPAYEQIWGRPLTSLLVNSTFWTEQVHPADQERVMEAFTAFYDQNIELEYRILRPDNESRWVWVRTFRIPDPVGNIYRIIGLVEDITPQKEAEEALRQALEKEKELNNLKTRFISTVSHEYRTRLAVIQMSTGILKRYRHRLSPEKQDEHIHRIEGQIKQMTNLLDNVLFIGRSDTGRLEFKPAPFDLKAFIANLLTDFGYVYENRQIDFICTAKSIELTADQQLVGYVLRNLISNALKYSPAEKPVQIELQAQPDQVVLRVVDQGIGIPAADQSHLFGLFYRATNVTNIQGTGLGLNIAKRAVEMHGGTIAFTSTEGEGTTFTVTLPYTPPA